MDEKYNELNTLLISEMHHRMELNERAAAEARRCITLTEHSLKEYKPGSAWAIVEQAIQDAAHRVLIAERANIESFSKAVEELRALTP